jgi:CRP-like cAMP-binding protein
VENILTRKLEAFAPLGDADKRLLDDVIRDAREVRPHQDLIQEGDVPSDVHLILEGFACRYKLLSEGRRHIMAYLLPGDFCDHHVFILKAMDHSIATLSRCKVVAIPRQRVLELTERPAIARAFWWAALVDEATLREWLVNIGRRSAEHRVAHLLCELLLRLRAVGLANGDRFELPLTEANNDAAHRCRPIAPVDVPPKSPRVRLDFARPSVDPSRPRCHEGKTKSRPMRERLSRSHITRRRLSVFDVVRTNRKMQTSRGATRRILPELCRNRLRGLVSNARRHRGHPADSIDRLLQPIAHEAVLTLN